MRTLNYFQSHLKSLDNTHQIFTSRKWIILHFVASPSSYFPSLRSGSLNSPVQISYEFYPPAHFYICSCFYFFASVYIASIFFKSHDLCILVLYSTRNVKYSQSFSKHSKVPTVEFGFLGCCRSTMDLLRFSRIYAYIVRLRECAN